MSRARGFVLAMVACLVAGCAFHQREAVDLDRAAEKAHAQGDFDRALLLYQRSAERWRLAGSLKIHAATLDNVARIHRGRGDFDLAVDAWQRALGAAKEVKDTPGVLRYLNNLGLVNSAWGLLDRAQRHYQEALELARTLNHRRSIALVLNNLGTVHRAAGRLDEALRNYQAALKIDRALASEEGIAARQANIASVKMDRGEFVAALEMYREALAVARRHKRQAKVATRLNNAGAALFSLRRYPEALEHYQEALLLHEKLGQRYEAATVLTNIGSLYWYLERWDDAERALERSVAIKEELRLAASGDVRRDYLASQIETYEWLTVTHVRAGRPREALRAADLSRAKYLADQLRSAGSAARMSSTEGLTAALQQRLSPDAAVVFFANVGWNKLIRFVVTRETVTAEELETTPTLERFAPVEVALGASRLRGNKRAFEAVIRLYRASLAEHREVDRAGARALYDLLLGGAEGLSGKRHLLIVPDGALAFLPFETLRTPEDRYLVEQVDVTYSHSLAVAELVERRRHPEGRQPLLAFGGAPYHRAGTKVAAADKRAPVKLVAWHGRRRAGTGERVDDAFEALGLNAWTDLPGTRQEVESLERHITGSTVMTGDKVREGYLKRLSKRGELAKYRVLHFSTHGLALPAAPSLSSLVLSQQPAHVKREDGYLTVNEIARLRIAADLVVLSACDTGLGKLYSGEGVVGLTQAFFVAGARAAVVSLWQVADDSTAALMLELHRRAQDDGQGHDRALSAAKRAFLRRHGSDGALAHPYHWAPFVYYGASSATR